MASWTSNDPCPDLKELEKKIGRKTPESLVLSIRDHAVDCDDGSMCDLDEKGDRHDIDNVASNSFSEKIKHLKGEMRGLRRADVQILWQLVAVHEGLEALRWLEEERGGALASGSSSLTGSQSSLGAAEGAGWAALAPSRTSPVRRDITPGCSPTREEPAEDPDTDEAAHQAGRSPPQPNTRWGEAGPPLGPPGPPRGPPGPERGARDLRWGAGRNNPTHAAGAGPDRHPGDPDAEKPPKPYMRVGGSTPPRDRKNGAQTAGTAAGGSVERRARGGGGGGGGGGLKEEAKTPGGAAEGRVQRNGWRQTGEEQLRAATALLGYDAQWRWVESPDDVTFL